MPIDAHDLYSPVLAIRPAQDGDRHVGGTGGEVDDADRLIATPGTTESRQMPDRRAGIQQERIHAADEPQAVAQRRRIDARSIHPFIFTSSRREIGQHVRVWLLQVYFKPFGSLVVTV